VITGYNTDVEHNGVVYHVQTEDKGLQTPVILSLVYLGGAILASKRSPYDDLIADGFNQEALAERLQRQHQLICAAVHTGRIEELKRLGGHGQAADTPAGGVGSAAPTATDKFAITEETQAALAISLLDEKQLRAGETVTFRIQVTKRGENGREPAANASLSLKTLGSSFPPSSTYSTTDDEGQSSMSVLLPAFKTGRAAILVRAEAGGEIAEVRRIIQPA